MPQECLKKIARWCHIETPSRLIVWLLAAGVFLNCGFIAYAVFDNFPYTMDEYNFWYQANIFAQGKRYLDLPHNLLPTVEYYMMQWFDRLFSKYPPGFPIILALGVKTGVAGLVNPFISALTTAVLFNTLRRHVHLISAALVMALLVTNSYFLGYASSYYTQPLSLLLWACGLYFLTASNSRYKNYLLGACVGYLFLVRPLDAFCLLLLAAYYYGFSRPLRQSVAPMLQVMALSAAGVLILYIYNWFLSECFCIAVYAIWVREFQIYDKDQTSFWGNFQSIARMYQNAFTEHFLPVMKNYFIPVIGWGFLTFAGLGMAMRFNRKTAALMLGIITLPLLYNFHFVSTGYPLYGARYWYPAIAPLTLLAGYGMEALRQRMPTILLCVLILLAVGFQLWGFGQDLAVYAERFDIIQSAQNALLRHCPEKSIVISEALDPKFYPGLKHHDNRKFVKSMDLVRNYYFDRSRIILPSEQVLRRSTQTMIDAVQPYFPDYTVCTNPYNRP